MRRIYVLKLLHVVKVHQIEAAEKTGEVYTHCRVCDCPVALGHGYMHGHTFDRQSKEQ